MAGNQILIMRANLFATRSTVFLALSFPLTSFSQAAGDFRSVFFNPQPSNL
jgi:hypothetical protein